MTSDRRPLICPLWWSSSRTVRGTQTRARRNYNNSQTTVGGAINRGAIVSTWTLGADGHVISGERAYDTVFMENTRSPTTTRLSAAGGTAR